MKEQTNLTAVRFDATPEDTKTIHKIVARTAAEFPGSFDGIELAMDLTATHLNGCPLNLSGLLGADLGSFGHDVSGIARHIDRETGELTGCFLPRYAQGDIVEVAAQATG